MKIYLSGLISDGGKLSDEEIENNRNLFQEAESVLRERGFQVINPIQYPQRDDWTWTDYMRVNIADLVRCDAIGLLENWWRSQGARLEFSIAAYLGFEVVFYP